MAHEDEKEIEELAQLLSRFPVLVTYVPLRTEVPFRGLVPNLSGQTYEIPPRAALDPNTEAAKATAFAAGHAAAILIPGRRFDSIGTRHGQGGGWYDRFLAQVPADWVRIGFCFADQLSAETLPRESWDQVMDYVCVLDRGTGKVRLVETDARAAMLAS